MKAVLILALLVLSACAKVEPSDTFCKTDADCVPLPSCHPQECVNEDASLKYEKPDICSMVFSCSAAYKQEDCGCVQNSCVNKNAGKTC